jgi:four helix bundle protein
MPGARNKYAPMSFETLRVYQAAEQLRAEVDKLAKNMRPEFGDAYRHFDEAVNSILNNIAEGSASIYPGKRRTFYDIALGSAGEARSSLRSLAQRGAFGRSPIWQPLSLCKLIGKMLTAMIARLE